MRLWGYNIDLSLLAHQEEGGSDLLLLFFDGEVVSIGLPAQKSTLQLQSSLPVRAPLLFPRYDNPRYNGLLGYVKALVNELRCSLSQSWRTSTKKS